MPKTKTTPPDALPQVRFSEHGLDLHRGTGLVAGVEITREEAADVFALTQDEVDYVFKGRP